MIISFANNIAKKELGVESFAAYKHIEDISGLEYLIKKEAENINSIIKPVFLNSNPINLDLTLTSIFSKDRSLEKYIKRMGLKQNVRQRQFDCDDHPRVMVNQALYVSDLDPSLVFNYEEALADELERRALVLNSMSEERGLGFPVLNYLQDNIYTHNYYDGVLDNRYSYTRTFWETQDLQVATDQKSPIDNYSASFDVVYSMVRSDTQEKAMDFGGLLSRVSQRNFLHSVPLNYFSGHALDSTTQVAASVFNELPTNTSAGGDIPGAAGTAINEASLKLNEFYDYLKRVNVLNPEEVLRSKLFCDPSQFINQHEFLAANGLNGKIGNFIFQPYVRLVDQDDRSFKSRKGKDLEPCDINDHTQGSIVEAGTLLPPGPILEDLRSTTFERDLDNPDEVSNPYSAHIFDVVSLPVFTWFINEALMPWLNKEENEDINVLFKDHGMKLFFKDIKFGMRMVYVSSFGPLSSTISLRDEAFQGWDSNLAYNSMIDKLKEMFGEDAFRRSKAGLTTRMFSLENRVDQSTGGFGKNAKLFGLEPGQEYLSGSIDGGGFIALQGLDVKKMPQLFNELHIPIVSHEESVDITKNSVMFDGMQFGYDSFAAGPTAHMISKLPNSGQNMHMSEFAVEEHKELVKRLVNTPSNFYFKHFAQRGLEKIKTSAEFRLIFDHLIPLKRYMAMAFLYSNDVMTPHIGDTTDLLGETKGTILSLYRNLLASSDDYTFMPEGDRDKLEIKAMSRGSGPPPESQSARIKKIIFQTLLLILKGFVEITDPAIITAKSIVDIVKAVYDAVIVAVETGFNAAMQSFQAIIDAAQSAIVQLEITVAIGGPTLQSTWDTLKGALNQTQPGLADEAVPALEVSDSEVTKWDIQVNEDFVVPEDAQGITQQDWESFVEAAKGLNEAISELKAIKTDLEEAKKDQENLKKDYETTMYGEDGQSGIKGEMDKVFGSNFLLPATWAAILPSITPYLGGIIPPPLVIGPPGTVPGIVYLILTMSDAYDFLKDDEMSKEKSDDPNCDDEL
jgi:hypothetical protein